MSSSFFNHLEAVRDGRLVHSFDLEKGVRNHLFDSFSALDTQIFNIPFYFSSNGWHLMKILAILGIGKSHCYYSNKDKLLKQRQMFAYLSIGQIGYVIIGIILADSNDGKGTSDFKAH